MTAAVTATLLGLASSQAMALSLGRMTVLSGLGEPLRAEIELPDITPEEASSLKPEVAPAEAFRAAGLEYNSALADLRIVLQRRPDGRSLLRINTNRAVSDPFLDLILQVNWSSGRIVRDYTILLDPPSMRQPPAAVTTAPQVPLPAPAAAARPVAPAAPVAAAEAPVARTPPAPRAAAAPAPAPAAKPAASNGQVTVKPGDTASKIVAAAKPANISLDQMLVALLRANPNAFINGNVNRMRTGAVLDLPDSTQAGATPPVEATQIINAQSRDFNAFRGKLAGSVPSVQTAGADRKASGKVQAEIDEKKPSAATPDKLTLSKGALKNKAAEDKIAREKADQEAATRVAELSKNINELNKLGASSAAVAASAASAPVAAPTVPVAVAPPPAAASEPAPVASAAASAPAMAEPAASAVPAAPIASAPASAVPPPPPPPVDDSTDWMEMLRENQLVLGGAALLALLGGFGLYSARKRKESAAADSSFLESRMQADSFFGASGGQRIDTNADDAPASSMSYSPSQLDAGSDVDPIAEADVYLAYGRDLQAEEILKEALRTNPDRVAIHAKLLEIYAKRRDVANFGGLAAVAHELTDGQGPEWERIAAMGRDLDPDNRLFQSSAQGLAAAAVASPAWMEDLEAGNTTQQADPDSELPANNLDLDLDLDFLNSELPADAAPTAQDAPIQPIQPTVDNVASLTVPAALDLPGSGAEMDFDGLDFDLDLSTAAGPLAAPAAAPAAPASPVAAAAPANDTGPIEFDLGSLSLDLDEVPPAEAAAAPVEEIDEGDPLATKLSLAEEFNSIGDEDGARALAEEVLEEATGALRAKAQKFLASLS
ncbi:FimV/HubP family polar landmark protein [Rhodoferax sp. OV413]|uniref:FimV/HubP family polar landmark protein n=1 Tax=Rhodoferax sp. OV413 TaxID=1855285 RepID=UPI0035188EBA